jgi:hypothetical protein
MGVWGMIVCLGPVYLVLVCLVVVVLAVVVARCSGLEVHWILLDVVVTVASGKGAAATAAHEVTG